MSVFRINLTSRLNKQRVNFRKYNVYYSNSKNSSYYPVEKKVPRCEECRYFGYDNRKPVCKLFTFATVVDQPDDTLGQFYIDYKIPRLDSSLCGLQGRYFKPKINK